MANTGKLELDTSLPIYKKRQTIEETISNHPVTILTAETGAGKSTQVPLWLWQKGLKVNVTQPRRIATRSLAHYLAKITHTTLGKAVGYQTGFDSRRSKETSLLYVTDGVQMVQEINNRRNYDVLVLDELHEWNLNQEVLVGLVKKNLDDGFLEASGKKIVIMSATLQAKKLAAFLGGAPVIEVEGRGYPVTMHHNNPHFLLPDTAQMVELERNVLVFQPGKSEIEEFIESLERMLKEEKIKATILPLHAELTLKEQSKVFNHYSLPKVVVSTDIAQTSLTIDDIDAVVDSGIKKEIRIVKGIEGLYPAEISAAECTQRAGRAGRVRNGQYFLCADAGINDRLPFPDPEIQRLNLENVVLRLIKMGLSPLDFPFFHLPSKALVLKAIKKLKNLGAISKEGAITADGNKMAEYPVSLRSARLLLEAQKTNAKVVDSAIKCIAILETKGIVNKEYLGERFISTTYSSDLLNQLAIWNTFKRNRKIINQKKFSLAKEIYKELKKRLNIKNTRIGPFNARDFSTLYRAIISSFADEVYVNSMGYYQQDNETRQLDRASILFVTKPEMITALPFDLVFTKENRDTGEKEETFIPLLTFASQLTLEHLDALKPFSYYKKELVEIEKAKVHIHREFYFGGKPIKIFNSSPDYKNILEKKMVVPKILKWFDSHQQKFDISERKKRIKNDFIEIQSMIKEKLKSFDFYWKRFLYRELINSLNMDDLDLFFKFFSSNCLITLKKLLPYSVINELKQQKWPQFHDIHGEQLQVFYIKRKAYLKFNYPLFEKVKESEIVLPTGERASIILSDKRFHHWQDAVNQYNLWKKREIFEKNLKNKKKRAHMENIFDIPFPQSFVGGRGKDNTPFEYFIIPKVEGEIVYLVHFLTREEAQRIFSSQESEWEEYKRKYKKNKIESIFKQKGWKVKP